MEKELENHKKWFYEQLDRIMIYLCSYGYETEDKLNLLNNDDKKDGFAVCLAILSDRLEEQYGYDSLSTKNLKD